MSIFTTIRDNIEYPFEKAWASIKPFFVEDVEPAIESFLKLFASDEGRFILQVALEEVANVAKIGFGAVSANIVTKVIEGSSVIAAQDAAKTLQQVQSALQIAKVSQNVTTAADQAIIAAAPTGEVPPAVA